MTLDESFQHCAVLGAAGKMGQGIAALVLQEMAKLELNKCGRTGTGNFSLALIDADETGFPRLKNYLKTQLNKYAEKQIVPIRKVYSSCPQLVSNQDIVQAFVDGAMNMITCSTYLEEAVKAHLVFEALPESMMIKSQKLNFLVKNAPHPQHYFSNTSSIPIFMLNAYGALNHHITGLHFYNPAPVQKLIEISLPENVDETTKEFAIEIAQRFGKTIIYTKDLPGFIGNGYFIREVAFADALLDKLGQLFESSAAIYAVNRLTQEFLIRPMGIFQLIDFVGIQVCVNIAQTMASLLQEPGVLAKTILQLNEKGITGGLGQNGSQAPGYFKYDAKGNPVAVYDINKETYIDLHDPAISRVKDLLGPLPEGHVNWKDAHSPEQLQKYFQNLVKSQTMGCQIVKEYLRACHNIAQVLVDTNIAQSSEDVNTVVKLGFHQLYGPLDSWVKELLQKEVPA